MELVGEVFDLGAQFQLFQPAVRDGGGAVEGAEDVAGDRAGAVAVAGMVDGQEQRAGGVVFVNQRAVNGDRQGFFADPAAAERLDQLGRWCLRSVARQTDGFVERFERLAMVVLFCQNLVNRVIDRFRKAGPVDDARDDDSEHAGAEIAGRMAVSDRSGVPRQTERLVRDQPDRGDAHHAAAAFAVVYGFGRRPDNAAPQRRKASVARSAPGIELGQIEKPASGKVIGQLTVVVRDLDPLRKEPPLIRKIDLGYRVGPVLAGADQAFGGKERHLRVVGDRPEPAVGRREVGQAVFTEFRTDLLEAAELQCGPERIADPAGEKTAPESVKCCDF